MKNILKYVLTFVVMVVLGIGALYLVTFIPKVMIKENVEISSEVLLEQGEKFRKKSLTRDVLFHNSTDAIMLNIVYGLDETDRLDGILKARRNYLEDSNQKVVRDLTGNLKSDYSGFKMTKELEGLVNGNYSQRVFEYARYWHGYIIILRIMLVFFDVVEIRIILQLLVLTLLTMLAYLLVIKHKKSKEAMVILLAFFMLDLTTWSYNIQGMFAMLIALIVSNLIAIGVINSKKLSYALFITGIMTAYFDFLTVPLVTCLLPIIVNNIVRCEDEKFSKIFIRFVLNVISWAVGYALFWGTKWIISDILTDTNIIKTSLEQILIRIGIKDNDKPMDKLIVNSLIENFKLLFNPLNLFVSSLFITIGIFNIINYGIKNVYNKNCFVYHMSIIAVVLWYVVCADHSSLHSFFTYRLLIPLIISVFLMAVQYDKENIKFKFKKEKIDDRN